MHMDKELWTIADVARRLKVSETTIRRLIEAGTLKALKIGGQWRIQESALTDLEAK